MMNNLTARHLLVPDEVTGFVDDLWCLLTRKRSTVALTKIDRRIGKLIVDEQDAGFEQSLVNRVYYALSDLILYVKEGSTLSAAYVLEEALESCRYEASNDRLIALGGGAVVHTDAFEQEIESDARVSAEKEKQSADKEFARTVTDWLHVDR